MTGELSHAGRPLTLLEADLQQTRAALTAARAEVAEADGVIAVWRRRTQQAEATAARLREALEYIRGVFYPQMRAVEIREWREYIDAALAAKEA